jgi:hypothetical protein
LSFPLLLREQQGQQILAGIDEESIFLYKRKQFLIIVIALGSKSQANRI